MTNTKKKCLAHIMVPSNFFAALCAVKASYETSSFVPSVTILFYNENIQSEKMFEEFQTIISIFAGEFSFIEHVVTLSKREYLQRVAPGEPLKLQEFLEENTAVDQFDTIVYSHDITGNIFPTLCRAYPGAERICCGDAFGNVYDRKTHLRFAGKSVEDHQFKIPHRAALLIPVDYYGNFLENVDLTVCKKSFLTGIIEQCLNSDSLRDFRQYQEKILETYRERKKYLFIMELFSEGKMLTLEKEIEMCCAIIKKRVAEGSVVFFKMHPAATVSLAESCRAQLKGFAEVLELDTDFQQFPVEIYKELLAVSSVICLSYASLALKYLYDMDTIRPVDENFVKNWFPPKYQGRLINNLCNYEDQLKVFDNWDGKSILWSGSVKKELLPQEPERNQLFQALSKKVKKLSRFSKIVICGGGSHTVRLLETFPILIAKTAAISTPKKNIDTVMGIPVMEESRLEHTDYDAILISSKSFELEICKRLTAKGIPRRKIFLLYSRKNIFAAYAARLLNAFKRKSDAKNAKPRNCWEEYKDYVNIHPTAIIAPEAKLTIYDPPDPPEICLEIGEGSHIFSKFTLFRPQARIKVGKRCQLGNVSFMAADTIEVGDDVIMAWGIFVLDSDNHSLYWADRQFDVERCRKDYLETNGRFIGRSHDWSKVRISKVTIKNKSWIGFNSIILKGVTIGEGAVVGAGSVVTRNVRPWYVAAGYPVQHLRKLPRSRNG